MKSISNMVVQLGGICGTNDLSEWEEGFVDSMFDYYDSGKLSDLSEKQLDILIHLYKKHFGDYEHEVPS